MSALTAEYKLMQKIIHVAIGQRFDTVEDIDREWSAAVDNDLIQDAESEVRGGQFKTDIPSPYSRHYEAKSVAAQMIDGSYVGWTYWYGGGKHGEPESVPWMEDAYDVDMKEVPTVVKVFTKRGAK